jgi:peptidoglycan hydrolase-like protein with peptidoglycan-binding domain
MTLVLVALGQGTQNYTCSNATATPSSIGAVAQLFNASCALSSDPTAGTASLGSIEESASIGAHFFLDNTTPDFDIIGLGNTVAKKVDDVPAPDAANDIKWLRLEAKEGSTSDVKMVYRLNTVGGLAPSTCAGMTAGQVVTVDYEAQYWIYA